MGGPSALRTTASCGKTIPLADTGLFPGAAKQMFKVGEETGTLDEQLEVSDTCTVLRDGAVVGEVNMSDVDKPTLARMMVGREVVLRVERQPMTPGRPVLEVESLTVVDRNGRRTIDDLSTRRRDA